MPRKTLTSDDIEHRIALSQNVQSELAELEKQAREDIEHDLSKTNDIMAATHTLVANALTRLIQTQLRKQEKLYKKLETLKSCNA